MTCLLLSATVATPALAEPFKFNPLIDARLRYEHVEQVPIAEDAEAVTLRARIGGELSNKSWSFLAEAEGTLAINEDYNSTSNGKGMFPIVADPENIELNRIQVQYKGIAKTLVTVGRQRINLDDQRFVGSVGWRQNEQTFDAARIEWMGVKDLKVDLTYSWSNRTIWGIDGFGANQQAVSGDNFFANVSYKTKIGTLTGFAYLVDQDETLLLGKSSQTFGARFAGAYPLSKAVKLTYAASYAHQSDYHNNPNNYSAEYYLGELGVAAYGFTLGGGYEVLGADNGVALTSFQTPLATLHKFQGWADKFLVTPPNGIKDLYGSIGYTKPKPFAGVDAISLTAVYHDYDSDRLSLDYGDEINLQLSVKVKKYTFLVKYADYNAKAFATDTKKFWASVEWAF
jgi:hypothetical protein